LNFQTFSKFHPITKHATLQKSNAADIDGEGPSDQSHPPALKMTPSMWYDQQDQEADIQKKMERLKDRTESSFEAWYEMELLKMKLEHKQL
jgi:hypothetical protein